MKFCIVRAHGTRAGNPLREADNGIQIPREVRERAYPQPGYRSLQLQQAPSDLAFQVSQGQRRSSLRLRTCAASAGILHGRRGDPEGPLLLRGFRDGCGRLLLHGGFELLGQRRPLIRQVNLVHHRFHGHGNGHGFHRRRSVVSLL